MQTNASANANVSWASWRRGGRWLVALLLGWLIASAWAFDGQGMREQMTQAGARVEAATQAVEDIRRALDDAESVDSLRVLSEKALSAQHEADVAASELEPELTQINARIEQLGPLTEGQTEDPELHAQREALQAASSTIDGLLKRSKLVSVEAGQLSARIESMRVRQFNAEILRKGSSPLSPSLWRGFAEHLPGDLNRMAVLLRQGQDTFMRAMQDEGTQRVLLGGTLSLLLFIPLRLWLRLKGRRFVVSPLAPKGRLRRSGLAVWLLVVSTALPTLAAWIWVECLRLTGAIAPRLELVAEQFVPAMGVASFIAALSGSVLMPHHRSWRLLQIDDSTALRLRKFAWCAAALVWVSMMLTALNRAARTSGHTTLALDGLIALTFVALIALALRTLSQQRRMRLQLHGVAVAGSDAPATPPEGDGPRSVWVMLAWMGGHVAVAAALIGALFGYINFALFAASQMVWMTVVVLATILLMKFVDDLMSALFTSNSALGRTLMQMLAIRGTRVEQFGVLLSAALRVLVLMVGVAAILAPYGNSTALYSWFGVLSGGITIGGAVLKPWALVRALLAFLVAMTVFKALQTWLVETYLPKTEMDIGARNSVSTVARYVGLTLSALWALAALGIGFEKIALLASALSVGIGFGLQAITQNFVSGLILLAERPVKLGDRVRVGDQEGDIRRISVRATEIQVDDKSTLIVPNSEFITKAVRNMTMGSPLGRVQLKFSVPLSTDVTLLRELLLGVYAEVEGVLESPAPAVFIDGIEGGMIVINSTAHVSSPRNVYRTRSEVLFALLPRLSAAGIPLVTPTDLHVIRGEAPASASAARVANAKPVPADAAAKRDVDAMS